MSDATAVRGLLFNTYTRALLPKTVVGLMNENTHSSHVLYVFSGSLVLMSVSIQTFIMYHVCN
jgi:hypothetical protein